MRRKDFFYHIFSKIGLSIICLFLVTFTLYCLIGITFNPFNQLLEYSGPDLEIRKKALTKELDLNTPIYLRYFKWLKNILAFFWGQGSFGISSISGAPVADSLGHAFGNSIIIVIIAVFLSVIIGTIIGLYSAKHQFQLIDFFLVTLFIFCYAVPKFIVAFLLKEGEISLNDSIENNQFSLIWVALGSFIIALIYLLFSQRKIKNRILISCIIFFLVFILQFISLILPQVIIDALYLWICLLLTIYLISKYFYKFSLKIILILFLLSSLSVIAYWFLNILFPNNYWQVTAPILIILMMVFFAIVWLFKKRIFLDNWYRFGTILVVIIFMTTISHIMSYWDDYLTIPQINFRPFHTTGMNTLVNDDIAFSAWELSIIDKSLYIFLPVLVQTIYGTAMLYRYVRNNSIKILESDFVLNLRARNIKQSKIFSSHILKHDLFPIFSILPLLFMEIFGATVVVESIFGYYGFGGLFLKSINFSDLNMCMGIILVLGVTIIFLNALFDFLISQTDQKIKFFA